MPFGKRPTPAATTAAPLPQSFPARLLLPGGAEQACEVTAIDPDGALFLGEPSLPQGTPLVALIDEIGRVEGTAGEPAPNGFWVDFHHDADRHPRFTRHLRWLIRRDHGLAAASRRHTRYEPRNRAACLTLPGGREQACEVIDVSLSGAAVRAKVIPSLGSPVSLEGMKGRVVRHLDRGFAIEFMTPLTPADLDRLLR